MYKVSSYSKIFGRPQRKEDGLSFSMIRHLEFSQRIRCNRGFVKFYTSYILLKPPNSGQKTRRYVLRIPDDLPVVPY